MSNLLRTIQQVTRDYVDSISHRLPSIKNGTVTATSSDGTATVRVDGDTATTGSVPSIAAVKTGDRVKMVLFNRQLTILGAIQRTDKLVADTIEGGIGGRNLVLDSDRAITTSAYKVLGGYLSEPWVEGATYTVTIKGSVNSPNQFLLYRNNGWTHVAFLTDYDAERGVYTATFVCPAQYEDRDPYEFTIYNYPQSTATSASIEWIKIERGSVATDWTIAPERHPRSESLSDGTNLNAVTVPGVYVMSGEQTYANNPAPGMWGFLEVTASLTGGTIRQVASRTTRTRYERWYTGGSWGTWGQL